MDLDQLLQDIVALVLDRDLDDDDVAFRGQQLLDHARGEDIAELAFDPIARRIDELRGHGSLAETVAAALAGAMVSRMRTSRAYARTRLLAVAA